MSEKNTISWFPIFDANSDFSDFDIFTRFSDFRFWTPFFRKVWFSKNDQKNNIFSVYDFGEILISENFSKNWKSEISDFKIIESFEIQKSWNWYESHISEKKIHLREKYNNKWSKYIQNPSKIASYSLVYSIFRGNIPPRSMFLSKT